MKHILMALVLIGLCHTTVDASATIVVGGNELANVDSLEVVDHRVYVKDIQVWPPVQRPNALRAELMLDTAPELSHNMFDAILASRTVEKQLRNQGYGTWTVADSIAALFRSYSSLVTTASVDSLSGQVWILWSNNRREEWLLDTSYASPVQTTDPAVSMAKLWRQLLARGCTIYVGDGYEFYVPARRAATVPAMKQALINRLNGKSNEVTDEIEQIEGKQSEILRDLQFPQPLDSLRTRR